MTVTKIKLKLVGSSLLKKTPKFYPSLSQNNMQNIILTLQPIEFTKELYLYFKELHPSATKPPWLHSSIHNTIISPPMYTHKKSQTSH